MISKGDAFVHVVQKVKENNKNHQHMPGIWCMQSSEGISVCQVLTFSKERMVLGPPVARSLFEDRKKSEFKTTSATARQFNNVEKFSPEQRVVINSESHLTALKAAHWLQDCCKWLIFSVHDKSNWISMFGISEYWWAPNLPLNPFF